MMTVVMLILKMTSISPDMDPSNEKKILDSMDMTPISQEYETELK